MVVATVLVVGQKLLPARAFVDVPLALAIVGLGIFVLMVPSALPGSHRRRCQARKRLVRASSSDAPR